MHVLTNRSADWLSDIDEWISECDVVCGEWKDFTNNNQTATARQSSRWLNPITEACLPQSNTGTDRQRHHQMWVGSYVNRVVFTANTRHTQSASTTIRSFTTTLLLSTCWLYRHQNVPHTLLCSIHTIICYHFWKNRHQSKSEILYFLLNPYLVLYNDSFLPYGKVQFSSYS